MSGYSLKRTYNVMSDKVSAPFKKAKVTKKLYRSKESFKTAVRKAIKAEVKNNDSQPAASSVISPAGILFPLNLIAEGDDINQRQGRKIRMVSVGIKSWFSGVTGSPAGDKIRLSLVVDKQPNAALATMADIYDVVGQGVISHRQADTYSDRFKVLKEWYMDFCLSSATSFEAPGFADMYLDMSKYPDDITQVNYGGTTAVIGSVTRNTYYLCASTIVTSVTNTSTDGLHFNARVRYTDF